MTTHVLLIRHGQTTWNLDDRPRGRADVPLDKVGRWQAQATAEYIAARWPLSAVYTSSLSRAMDTAAAIAIAQGLQVQPLEGLLDVDYGEWQGLPLSSIEARYPDLFRTWAETPDKIYFPGGEGLEEVGQRSTTALRGVIARHPEETVALVAHATVNRVLLCAVLGLGNDHHWQLNQDTCAVNLIEWNGRQYRLSLMNDTSHLWGAQR
jgi:broad specificity phosphatase PhoE